MDTRPLCSKCHEQHWPTEGCVRTLVMAKPVASGPMKSSVQRIIEEAIREQQKQELAEAKKLADDANAKAGLLSQPSLKVSWTQAICDDCHVRRFGTGKNVARISQPGREQCCDCGMPTTSGIYLREDPMTVRYPRVVVPDREYGP